MKTKSEENTRMRPCGETRLEMHNIVKKGYGIGFFRGGAAMM
jgi:hypothetical protein